MASILPIIRISELQRGAKAALEGIEDYAVIRTHGRDTAFVLHPRLGKILLESGMLEMLKKKQAEHAHGAMSEEELACELERTIGGVLRELSKQ